MSNISQRLDLRHSQNLVMTPQLQQAIKLLQMSNMELAEFVEAELAQNPLLEKPEPEADVEAPVAKAETDDMQGEFDEVWTGNEAAGTTEVPGEALPDFDPGAPMAGTGVGGNTSFDNPELSLENTLAQTKTLRDHLLEQLNMTFEDARDRMIGALLIDMLDEGGYLRQDTAELAGRLGCPPQRVERLLRRLRQFDPTGLFARDLKECLMLQLEDQGKCDAPMRALLENLPMLAAHDFAGLAKKCAVNETYLRDMVDEVRALNPRPAADFDHMTVQTVVPDVLMKRLPKSVGGGWRVELNNDTLPKVLVNQQYYAEVSSHAKDKQEKDYLDRQIQNAHWLVRAMDQRAKTILKVASEIVEEQDAFFLYGVEYLRPLTLKDIALRIGMHESTVSRVTTGKYIGTPRGMFELKYFFTTALGNGEGAHSSEAVKSRIKTMIDAEDVENVLSDDTIMEALQKDGIEIARRTVAKYREALGLPSSVQRRRQKKDGR